MTLAGKVALITGGASGLGKALADALHSQGVTLILADINKAVGINTAEEFNKLRKGSAFFQQMDVVKWEDQVQAFKESLEHVKRIDYVFANAGVSEAPFLPFTSAEKVEWIPPKMSTTDVNFLGVLYTCQIAAQVFRTQPVVDGFRGKIIITTSSYSFTPGAYMPLYSASKYGLVGFIRSFSEQLASESVTVNGVAPNLMDTNIIPGRIADIVQEHGGLTSTTKVAEVLMSFLGECTDTGVIKEVSVDDIVTRPPLEPLNKHVTANVNLLADAHKAMWSQRRASSHA